MKPPSPIPKSYPHLKKLTPSQLTYFRKYFPLRLINSLLATMTIAEMKRMVHLSQGITADSTPTGGIICTWEDIERMRKNRKMQRYKDHKKAKRILGRGIKCPECSRAGTKLLWLYYSSDSWTWENMCGCSGWIAACENCKIQVAFYLHWMN